ncbi:MULTISPECIES: GatB/YqeY domain-containing protein [Thermomicrobium]|uniref:GatB/Yqey domain superfamily n=1 Tax=Thermomicrobium roseum (strain ATCC 27502 / DSM 5159 / P-2) TaxID=309801 RepID=B9L1N0_THERP|nr:MULTISPECIES: GatB/YqeY domain-containing protein [Thermomicrobium]ACM04894.1 GatB/Yqey domain superfamily [Thermomicrobium roseum DSM 5159]MBO9305608.1 GatB/YqeY domain-containing protein [Thermomicrobium sp.]MBO9349860.1 GatB/YqeY domain-containing protein [Thermomicrobium sp.]
MHLTQCVQLDYTAPETFAMPSRSRWSARAQNPTTRGNERVSTLAERLLADLQEAVKTGDVTRREVIRFLRAEIKNREIDKGRPLTDEEIIEVIRRQIKMRREAIEQFAQGGRQDLVEREEAQIRVLETYLPQQLSPDELMELARAVVREVGATGPRDMGRVMPVLRERVGPRAEGRAIAEAAQKALAEVAGS